MWPRSAPPCTNMATPHRDECAPAAPGSRRTPALFCLLHAYARRLHNVLARPAQRLDIAHDEWPRKPKALLLAQPLVRAISFEHGRYGIGWQISDVFAEQCRSYATQACWLCKSNKSRIVEARGVVPASARLGARMGDGAPSLLDSCHVFGGQRWLDAVNEPSSSSCCQQPPKWKVVPIVCPRRQSPRCVVCIVV